MSSAATRSGLACGAAGVVVGGGLVVVDGTSVVVVSAVDELVVSGGATEVGPTSLDDAVAAHPPRTSTDARRCTSRRPTTTRMADANPTFRSARDQIRDHPIGLVRARARP
jgi:hypothetical protein